MMFSRLLFTLLAAAITLDLQTRAPLRAQETGGRRFFRVSEDSDFSRPREVLGRLVARKAKTRKNTFCVIGYRYPDGNEQAWVHWREGRAVILWEPVEGLADLTQSRRYLRIPRDVVADEAALKGSSYLVTRKWVDTLLGDCREHGETLVLYKKRTGG